MNFKGFLNWVATTQVMLFFLFLIISIWVPELHSISNKMIRTSLIMFLACLMFYFGVKEDD